MNVDLETALRSALAARASDVPPATGARLRTVEYRPRTRRLPGHPAVGVVAGAATVGTATSIALLVSSQPAFAGWSPTPTQTLDAPSASAASVCQAQLAALPSLPGTTDNGPWTPLATDVRGPFTVVIYEDGANFTTCFTGPPFTVVNRSSIGTGSGTGTSASASSSGGGTGLQRASQSITQGTGGIEQASVSHLASTSDGPYTLVEGRIDSDVSAVSLVTDDGQDVQATTGNGWFVAWWPGSQDVISAEVTTPSGTSGASLGASVEPSDSQPPSGSSSTSPSSGASSSGPSSSSGASSSGPSTSADGSAPA